MPKILPGHWGETDRYLQMNRFSSKHNRLTVKASGKLPIDLEEPVEYASN